MEIKVKVKVCIKIIKIILIQKNKIHYLVLIEILIQFWILNSMSKRNKIK
jgi:hypothetical protein